MKKDGDIEHMLVVTFIAVALIALFLLLKINAPGVGTSCANHGENSGISCV